MSDYSWYHLPSQSFTDNSIRGRSHSLPPITCSVVFLAALPPLFCTLHISRYLQQGPSIPSPIRAAMSHPIFPAVPHSNCDNDPRSEKQNAEKSAGFSSVQFQQRSRTDAQEENT